MKYLGAFSWTVKLPGEAKRIVELRFPTGNEAEDAAMVRYHLRKELNLKRLPKGTLVDWVRPIS